MTRGGEKERPWLVSVSSARYACIRVYSWMLTKMVSGDPRWAPMMYRSHMPLSQPHRYSPATTDHEIASVFAPRNSRLAGRSPGVTNTGGDRFTKDNAAHTVGCSSDQAGRECILTNFRIPNWKITRLTLQILAIISVSNGKAIGIFLRCPCRLLNSLIP